MFAVHVTRVNDVTNVMLLITTTSFTCLSPVHLQLPIAAFIVSQTCVRLLLNGLCLQRQPYLRHNFIPKRNRAILHSVIFNSITELRGLFKYNNLEPETPNQHVFLGCARNLWHKARQAHDTIQSAINYTRQIKYLPIANTFSTQLSVRICGSSIMGPSFGWLSTGNTQ